MRILVITMQFPQFPAPGGETRQFYLLREAAKEHEITLLTVANPPTAVALEELKSFIKEVITVQIKQVQKASILRWFGFPSLIHEVFARDPSEVKKWKERREIREYLAKITHSQFDLLQIEHSEIAHWLDNIFLNVPKILVLHNVNYLIYRRFFNITPWSTEKIRAMWEWWKMKKYEASLSNKFNKFITMSEEDKNLFLEIAPSADVEVIPNGVDTEYFSSPTKIVNEENALVYTGYMGWKPSEDAVLYFQRYIFSELLKKYPDLKFYIVGKDPSPAVQELSKQKNIIVTGYVEDVRPYMEKSKLVIVPLRAGGGTRLKVLEAMSMGKAVVSTSIGAEGLNVHHGRDIFLADSPKEFVDSVCSLLDNEKLRTSIGEKARINMIHNYDWKLIGKQMRDIYNELCNKH